MSSTIVQPPTARKSFEPGTTGWTAADLDDPQMERLWLAGNYEIVEGVLTTMPPAYFSGGAALHNLSTLISLHLRDRAIKSAAATEVDIELADDRIVRPDLVFVLTLDELRSNESWKNSRLKFPPTLIIESLSVGHEAHDAKVKRQWYAEFGVKNYWLLNSFARALECLVLDNGNFRIDQTGKQNDELKPSLFPGLTIPLGQLWE